jgi:hypothetical protein
MFFKVLGEAGLQNPKAGGPSIFGQDTWSQINISLTGKSKEGGALTSRNHEM